MSSSFWFWRGASDCHPQAASALSQFHEHARNFGISIVPILGAAGVVGLAVGICAQSPIKDYFNVHGIEIPYPHLTIYAGQNKHGNAPAFRLSDQNQSGQE
jgi:small-conductance mechanosensitive channel